MSDTRAGQVEKVFEPEAGVDELVTAQNESISCVFRRWLPATATGPSCWLCYARRLPAICRPGRCPKKPTRDKATPPPPGGTKGGEGVKIGTRFDFVEGEFDTDTDELVCVGNKKYGQVSLCFVTKNLNVGFAKIKLFSRDRAVDADATYEDAMALGEEIARRWNVKSDRPRREAGAEEGEGE